MIVKFPKGFMASLPKKIRNELVLAASKYVYEEEGIFSESTRGYIFMSASEHKITSRCPTLKKCVFETKGFKFEEVDISAEYKAVLELEQKAAKAEQLTAAMDTFGKHLNQQTKELK